jgi:protocatechuate 3,4-dioxygenase beta subunit
MPFDDATITEASIASLADTPDPRLRGILTSLIRHLHGFVREVRPTPEEWLAAIRFLTTTGQICDAERQEFILLSDTLGVSMLVDAINHAGATEEVTESSVLGPFYRPGAPLHANGDAIFGESEGEPVVVGGQVSSSDGSPIAGALVEVWQTAPNGLYYSQDPEQEEFNLCGQFHTAADGRFQFRSLLPRSYPIPADGPVGAMLRATRRNIYRPAHIHFKISAEGHRGLITELYSRGDEFLRRDPVFGVKDSLVVEYRRIDDGLCLDYDFVLARSD